MANEKRLRASLLAAIALIAVLAVYDLARAGTTRCTLAGHERIVLTLADLDVLPGPAQFSLETPAQPAFGATQTLAVSRGQALALSGTARDGNAPAAAVFAVLDGVPVRAAYTGERYRVTIPPAALGAGTHDLHFAVVARDLSGYYIPRRLDVDVR